MESAWKIRGGEEARRIRARRVAAAGEGNIDRELKATVRAKQMYQEIAIAEKMQKLAEELCARFKSEIPESDAPCARPRI